MHIQFCREHSANAIDGGQFVGLCAQSGGDALAFGDIAQDREMTTGQDIRPRVVFEIAALAVGAAYADQSLLLAGSKKGSPRLSRFGFAARLDEAAQVAR